MTLPPQPAPSLSFSNPAVILDGPEFKPQKNQVTAHQRIRAGVQEKERREGCEEVLHGSDL